MPNYRAYAVGPDEHFIGYEPFICADDGEAIEKAKRLSDRHPVELWSGPRLVGRVNCDRADRQDTTARYRFSS
jgi:hypothetical protein